MQIHELDNYNGNLDSTAYLAVDNGSDTGKVSTAQLLHDVNSEIDDLDTSLNARIDNIIAGGTAPSVAEVTDARLGEDGVTYPSLGDAIRTQVGDLSDDIDFVNEPIEENISVSIESGYYDANGNKNAASGYWQEQRTTKINVKSVENIKWSYLCNTLVTQGGVYLVKWDKDGSFIERTEIIGQSSFDRAHGYYSVESGVGFVAFYFSTRGNTVTFDIVANRNIELMDKEIDDINDRIAPAPTFTIESGYYDGGNGSKQPAGAYWDEKRTTPICVDNVKAVKWSFECEELVGQNGIALSKWSKDGSFIERVTIKNGGTYQSAEGLYIVEDGVWTIGFNYTTRGYNSDFFINNEIDYLSLVDDVTDINSKLDGTDVVVGNQDAITKICASRWTEDDDSKPVSLLWFTDPHRQTDPLTRLIEFKNYLKTISMVDDTICTGDIVLSSSEETTQFTEYWTDTPGTSDILIACGNHEWYANSAQPHTKMTISQIDQMYFSDTSEWGIVRSGINPYYYKDYSDQNVRLIVVDPAVTDSELNETSWLQSVLSDAIANDLAVIVATHFLRGSFTIYDSNWTEVDKRGIEEFVQGYDWAGCDIISCVTEFISNGGTFICYMQGHTHSDYLAYPVGYPEQLVVSLASASWRRGETPFRTNDLPRYAATRTMDCFNLISVDSNRKVLKCVRIGANVNMFEEPRTAFSYNYDTRQFISTI